MKDIRPLIIDLYRLILLSAFFFSLMTVFVRLSGDVPHNRNTD